MSWLGILLGAWAAIAIFFFWLGTSGFKFGDVSVRESAFILVLSLIWPVLSAVTGIRLVWSFLRDGGWPDRRIAAWSTALVAFLSVALLVSCATPAPVREVAVQEVVITRTERAVAASDVPTPPAPLAARPADISASLDLALAQVCAWVAYAEKADPLLQIAAGIAVAPRVQEPACGPAAAATLRGTRPEE